MFRIWGKIMKDNRFLADHVHEIDNPAMPKSEKIEDALDAFTLAFDIQKPMWFDKNTKDMIQFSKTAFYDDQFIESISFDYFEIEIIEEDKEEGA
jgi:hypothetical protein